MTKSTDNNKLLSYTAIAISIFALVFSLVTYQDVQAIRNDMQEFVTSLQMTEMSIEENLEQGLMTITQQTNQTGEELEANIQNLRNSLASQYENAETEVQAEWQALDAELAVIQADAVDNTDSALERIQVLLENLQIELQQ